MVVRFANLKPADLSVLQSLDTMSQQIQLQRKVSIYPALTFWMTKSPLGQMMSLPCAFVWYTNAKSEMFTVFNSIGCLQILHKAPLSPMEWVLQRTWWVSFGGLLACQWEFLVSIMTASVQWTYCDTEVKRPFGSSLQACKVYAGS